ncbi:Soluble pyridine nucleotide transhydrogenase [Planctomycetales bacterium 10988]|nr:Soluble pyridine nucleotide transhydrogenase [Planctomycetales bacterium 10988]
MYDTVIIGAGMSGLAAGIRLAYFDQKVCIVERHTTIGGLNSFYRLRGRSYDVGLHALTNYTPKGTKKGPLARLLRQLRIGWDEFALVPQIGSTIAFPDVTLSFKNDFEYFRQQVNEAFPHERDNFERLFQALVDYDDLDYTTADRSAREVVGEYLNDPYLIEMLFLPLMYYGSARENDMDFAQFCIMFRSIFCEGFARPFQGVRLILKKLSQKYRSLGGELKLRTGVSKLAIDNGRVKRVVLDDGSEILAKRVLSSAGWVETLRMCDDLPAPSRRQAGQVSFVETISSLDRMPQDFNHDQTIVFFNDSSKFHYEKPDGLVDLRSGVICSPNNYQYDEPLKEGVMRVTCLANFDRWADLPEEEYRLAKLEWYDRINGSAIRFVPDYRSYVVETDTFTPTTIQRFTWHDNGAVYGAPQKRYDGTTHLRNLFVCGTDQGFMGIVGAITSGISMANWHCLR